MALQAPYGTDEQPSWAVKIVGGQSVQVQARRKSGKSEETPDEVARTPFKYSEDPPWHLNYKDSGQLGKVRLQSITTTSSQKSRVNLGKTGEQSRGIGGKNNNGLDAEGINHVVSELLTRYPPSDFKKLYCDMAECDHRGSGYLSEQQVEKCLKRHQVPVPPTVLKTILPKFSAGYDVHVEMINYESLIEYLVSVCDEARKSDRIRQPPSKAMKLSERPIPSYLQSLTNDRSHVKLSSRSLVKKAMDDREEASLLVQIEQTFKTTGPKIVEILDNIHKDLQQLSDGLDCMLREQIKRHCSSYGLPLNPTLFDKILNRFKAEEVNKIKWLECINFLEKGVPLSIQQSMTSQKPLIERATLPRWERKAPLGPVKSSPRKPRSEDATFGDHKVRKNNTFPTERRKWDNPVITDNSHEQPGSSFEILKVERSRKNETGGTQSSAATSTVDMIESNHDLPVLKPDSPVAQNENEANISDVMRDKLERFTCLTNAFLRHDTDGVGTLTQREVFPIIHTHNLVYNLNLPSDKVHEAIQSCTMTNSNDVVTDDLLPKLWYLMK